MQSKILAEGKTKIILETHDPNVVLIQSKDDITAGDGERRDILDQKGVFANQTTCNCFELLRRAGIPTHYLGSADGRTFRAKLVKMLPIELVARRVAFGSYLKRNPALPEGTRFDPPLTEHFLKDDARHDPLIVYDYDGRQTMYFAPKQPLDKPLEHVPMENPAEIKQRNMLLDDLLVRTFLALEAAWAAQDVQLVDLKIECGYDNDGNLVVADVVDNDSWRIWPQGKKEKMLDKQVYRDLPEATQKALLDVLANYATVARATQKFVA